VPTARPPATVIVPAYQEESGIARTVRELDAMCGRLHGWDWEIVVVDDGSTDGTCREAAVAAAAASTPVRILRHPRNTGLGGALRTGIAASRGELVLTADCDLSYSVETLERLVAEYITSGAQVVIASPYMPGGRTVAVPRALEIRSRAANAWLRAASLDDVYTLTGMVRAYDGALLRSMSLKAVDADINVEIIYKAQVLRVGIVEIPATLDWSALQTRVTRSRLLARRSRWNTYKQLVNGYLWRPFWFPLAVALVLAVPALVLLFTGRLGWHGVAVVCSLGSLLLAFLALASLQVKRYFEELYTLGTGIRAVVGTPPPVAEPVSTDRRAPA
jgi:glycosyltransferase involved in cell wall biosynthesis